jgi:hypothetical protein
MLLLVVFDRRGAQFLKSEPWFAASPEDQVVVRVIAYW